MPDTPFHILLVEDDASVREAVAASLRDEGYAVATAADGQQAIKAGAAAYLTNPLDPGELLVQVRKSLEDKRLRQELSRLRGQLREGWHYRHIIGKSPSMRQVFSVIDRAATVKTTVLIDRKSTRLNSSHVSISYAV